MCRRRTDADEPAHAQVYDIAHSREAIEVFLGAGALTEEGAVAAGAKRTVTTRSLAEVWGDRWFVERLISRNVTWLDQCKVFCKTF